MGARSGGRAIALQILFGLDASGALDEGNAQAGVSTVDVTGALERYWRSFEDREAQTEDVDPEARAFADALVRDVMGSIGKIDEAIQHASINWRLARMPRVDRNVVRIGAFELLVRRDVPRAVAIDEAVELAKRFGGDDSAKFVNGLLERVADEAGREEPRDKSQSRPPRRRR